MSHPIPSCTYDDPTSWTQEDPGDPLVEDIMGHCGGCGEAMTVDEVPAHLWQAKCGQVMTWQYTCGECCEAGGHCDCAKTL